MTLKTELASLKAKHEKIQSLIAEIEKQKEFLQDTIKKLQLCQKTAKLDLRITTNFSENDIVKGDTVARLTHDLFDKAQATIQKCQEIEKEIISLV